MCVPLANIGGENLLSIELDDVTDTLLASTEPSVTIFTLIPRPPGVPEPDALTARERIMTSLAPSTRDFVTHHATGSGFAMTIARTLTRDPADRTELHERATRLHTSVNTLQRDFTREFGMPYSRWRTLTRLRAAHALLESHPVHHPVHQVAHRVGYANPSSFITAFTTQFGYTPGRTHRRSEELRRNDKTHQQPFLQYGQSRRSG